MPYIQALNWRTKMSSGADKNVLRGGQKCPPGRTKMSSGADKNVLRGGQKCPPGRTKMSSGSIYINTSVYDKNYNKNYNKNLFLKKERKKKENFEGGETFSKEDDWDSIANSETYVCDTKNTNPITQ